MNVAAPAIDPDSAMSLDQEEFEASYLASPIDHAEDWQPVDGERPDSPIQAREQALRDERESLYARLNPRQLEAASLPKDHSVLILAGAGSGKTSVITARVAKLIDDGMAAREILAVTFTNKSSEEMKTRLRKLLDTKTVNDIMVGTFHSLCSKILRDHFAAAGLPKSFAILDVDGQEAVCRGALKDLGLTKSSVKESAKARANALASIDLLTPSDSLVTAGGLTAGDLEDDGEVNEFVTPSQCAKYIASRKEAGELPIPQPQITTQSTDVEQMESVFMLYQERCAKAGLLDFQDLLTKTVGLLEKDKFVRDMYRSRFSCILVDEFQDTNDIQYRWLELLKGKNTHVMAVGDDYQSIYAFRGANPKNMFRFLREMCTDEHAPDGRMVKLEQNYRSLPHILETANAIIANNSGQMAKTLFTSQPDQGELIDLVTYGNGVFEASSIARSIHRFIKEDGVPPTEIAVLYRTNQQSRLIEQELNKMGLPLTVYGGFRFFERQEVKIVLAYMDLVSNMTRDISFAKIANFPPRGLGERTIEELRQLARAQNLSMMEVIFKRSEMMANDRSSIGNAAAQKKQQKLEEFANSIMDMAELALTQPLHVVINAIVDRFQLKEHYLSEAGSSKLSQADAAERNANMAELISAATQFEIENEGLTDAVELLPEYLAYVALMTSTSESDMSRKNTISLMTVHSSKGLEFDHVFIAGLDETVFPHSRAIQEDADRACLKPVDESLATNVDPDDGEGLQEERRLMYVAVTRARKTLTLTHAQERMINGEIKAYDRSRFLDEIPVERLNQIDDRAHRPKAAKNGFGALSNRHGVADFGNHEYGGDAFDDTRDPLPEAHLAKSTDATVTGGVRVVSKRKERGSVVELPGETVIDLDRSHPILGNRHYLNNHEDADERARVIAAYNVDYQADLKVRGPMFLATQQLAARVAEGERLALRCWCAPRDCHAHLVATKIEEMVRERQTDATPMPSVKTADTGARRMAIIGTAGRDKEKPMTAALWEAMVKDARARVTPADTLISGGAAWADHLAVRLFLDGSVGHLVLHLPAPLENDAYLGPERNSSGSAANYYHGLFKRITGVDGLQEIDTAIARGATVTCEPVAPGYGAMHARNRKVAQGSNAMLAYTFCADGTPADGGTKGTWDQSPLVGAQKVHVDLGALVAPAAMTMTPAQAVPAPAVSAPRSTDASIDRAGVSRPVVEAAKETPKVNAWADLVRRRPPVASRPAMRASVAPAVCAPEEFQRERQR